jgi:hypothetical protein
VTLLYNVRIVEVPPRYFRIKLPTGTLHRSAPTRYRVKVTYLGDFPFRSTRFLAEEYPTYRKALKAATLWAEQVLNLKTEIC